MTDERTPQFTERRPVDRAAWSCAEVAESLGISTKEVRRMVQRGELPAFRIGRRVLVRPADVQALTARLVDA